MNKLLLVLVVILVIYLLSKKQENLCVAPPTAVPGWNTVHRPNVSYEIDVPRQHCDTPYTVLVKLLYTDCSENHILASLFEKLRDEYQNDPISKTIRFESQRVNLCDVKIKGPFPQIFKYSPTDGIAVQYKGENDFGQLSDWIRNDSLFR